MSPSSSNVTGNLLWRPAPRAEFRFSVDYLDDDVGSYFGTPLLPADAIGDPLDVITARHRRGDRRADALPQLQRDGRRERLVADPAARRRRGAAQRPGHAAQYGLRVQRGAQLAERGGLSVLHRGGGPSAPTWARSSATTATSSSTTTSSSSGTACTSTSGRRSAGSRTAPRSASRCPRSTSSGARLPAQHPARAGRRGRRVQSGARTYGQRELRGVSPTYIDSWGVLRRRLAAGGRPRQADRRPALRGDGPGAREPRRGGRRRAERLRARVPLVELAHGRGGEPARRPGGVRPVQQRQGSGERQHPAGERQPGTSTSPTPASGRSD